MIVDINLAYVQEILDNVSPEIHQIPGVVGTGITHSIVTGIGDGYNIIVYLEYYSSDILSMIPTEIQGIPITVQVIGKVYALTSGCTKDTPCFGKKYRPIQGGASIENTSRIAPSVNRPWTGTLAGFPKDSQGRTVLLSNNHVIAGHDPDWQVGQKGDIISQQSKLDGGGTPAERIGTLEKWIDIQTGTTAQGIKNKVDAAYALIDSNIQINTINLCNYNQGKTVSPSIGMSVKKAGRSTGCTEGIIQAINVNINVGYGSSGRVGGFTDQISSTMPIQPGDSGSLVVTSPGENVVGLAFASGGGLAIINKMTNVESLLGISFGGSSTTCPTLTMNFSMS